MATRKITLSEVNKKRVRIVSYLLVSGVLGWILAKLAGSTELIGVFAPAINFILYSIDQEVKNEGYIKALK